MGNFETIADVSGQLSNKTLSSAELCKELLSEVTRQNPTLGAYSDILEETALSEAAASDARRAESRQRGPLDGIPVAVKDIIDTHPAVCKAGLEHLSGYRPTADATVVKLLRDAGAVILGVTETDPGAFSTETPLVVNPLARTRSTGGSSGGSGAAVAAGLAYAALGTDTGGSVRIPAACCSVHGFKPTWGRVDVKGVRPLAPSLDHVGVFARNMDDLRIVQAVLDPLIGGIRDVAQRREVSLGISEAYFADADDIVKQAMADVVGKLRSCRVRLYNVSLPTPDDVFSFHMINLPWEAAAYHATQFPDEWPNYPDVARLTVEKGKAISAAEHERAEKRRRNAISVIDAALDGVDALILPTMPIDAPQRCADAIELAGKMVSKLEATIRYTSLFNQSGHPVISMPATLLPDGRALSIQLVGRRDGDGDLLMLARRVEGLLQVDVNYASIIAGQAPEVHNIDAVVL